MLGCPFSGNPCSDGRELGLLPSKALKDSMEYAIKPVNTELALIISQGFKLHVNFAGTSLIWDLLSAP